MWHKLKSDILLKLEITAALEIFIWTKRDLTAIPTFGHLWFDCEITVSQNFPSHMWETPDI